VRGNEGDTGGFFNEAGEGKGTESDEGGDFSLGDQEVRIIDVDVEGSEHGFDFSLGDDMAIEKILTSTTDYLVRFRKRLMVTVRVTVIVLWFSKPTGQFRSSVLSKMIVTKALSIPPCPER
jgi:hypothetical protein